MITKEYLQQELAKRIDGYKRGVETSTDNIIAEMKSILVLVDALPDYEKKYNHTLEVVRELQKDWASTQNRAAREIELAFPELRESEDERMMREFNDWLCEEIECRTNDLRDEKDRMELNMLCYILTKVKDWLKKQKEQKPNYCHHEVDETGWTEEYRKAYYDGWNNCNMQHEQLKSDQKLAEWSEEDEKHINLILRVLDIQQCWDGATGKKFNPYQDEIDWLKSLRLRPSWKPSEEQMSSLKQARDYYMSGGIKYVGRHLSEIAEQLEKL